MVLQAYADDSGNDPQASAFILAGYVANIRQWEGFTDAWQKCLDTPPQIDYFKSNQAYGMKGQFSKKNGWTEDKRDIKILDLVKIMRSHIPEQFVIGVSYADYERTMLDIPMRNRFVVAANPYFFLFYQFILFVSGYDIIFGLKEPCTFIFDEQGKIGRQSVAIWDMLKQIANGKRTTHDFTSYLGERPHFGDDKWFLPLQAADLLAGQWSRHLRGKGVIIPPSPVMTTLQSMNGWTKFFTEEELCEQREHLLRTAKNTERLYPGSLKHFIGGNRKPKREKK